jgi:hypothetical protein
MRRFKRFLFFAACVPLLFACGGGGDAGSAEQTGQVTVLVGDDPTLEWDSIELTIAEVRFLTQGGQDSIVLNEPVMVDFLDLQNFTEVLITRDVVTGTILAVRFVLTEVKLTRMVDGVEEVQYPRIPGNGKFDVNIRPTHVRAGERVALEFDFDLGQSLFNETGSGLVTFRPVIKGRAITADALAAEGGARMMRVEGDVDGLTDNAEPLIRVCDIRSAAMDDANRPHNVDVCVLGDLSDAQIIDPESAGGPTVATGDHIVMYGRFDTTAEEDTMLVDVIAVGAEFVRLRGLATSEVADSAFMLDVGGDADAQIALRSDAKVFDAEPKEVPPEVIMIGNEVEAEGYPPMSVGDPDVSAFIALLGHEVMVVGGTPVPTGEVDLEQVTGTIDLYGAGFVTVMTDSGVQDCVMYTAETEIVQIDSTGTQTVVSQVDVPTAGAGPRTIDARGTRGAQCLDAVSIVVE